MDKYEFKINYYFNMYKDEPLQNTQQFKKNFIKKHGNFQYINEIILRINQYQVKKYGNGLIRFGDFVTPEQFEKKRINANARQVKYHKTIRDKK